MPGSTWKALEEFLKAVMSVALQVVVTVGELPEVSSSWPLPQGSLG